MKKILVFPCGSEIGLEIYRSLCFSSHFELIGGSSVDDHGKFVYENYIGGIPFHTTDNFLPVINEVIEKHNIDAIYPAMDAVAKTLHDAEERLSCRVIGSSRYATDICASKYKTYRTLNNIIPVPKEYPSVDDIDAYPVFIKPDRGYGARGCLLASSREQTLNFFSDKNRDDYLILENLPGKEWTVDCFSSRQGELLFCAGRGRNRISNGISVNTAPETDFRDLFAEYAKVINEKLSLRGAWFFQVKQNRQGRPVLLEVAARLGGSSGVFRMKGVNFALLSCFDAFDLDVGIIENKYEIEMDRALDCTYRINMDYENVYVDFDDCLIINEKVNAQLVRFLYEAVAEGKGVHLVTRHNGDLERQLKKYRLSNLFDSVFHLRSGEKKSSVILPSSSLFIDDSYSERQEVFLSRNIPVFSPDMLISVSFGKRL